MLVLKLPRFYPLRIDERKSAAISKQTHLLTPSSRPYIVLALRPERILERNMKKVMANERLI